MAKLSNVLRSAEDGRLMYFCQGCDCHHSVGVGAGSGPRWEWNGDAEKPTFRPSVLYSREMSVPPVTPSNYEEYKRNPWPQTKQNWVCHTFITDGMVQFLSDCSHQYAGQTLPLPEMFKEGTE